MLIKGALTKLQPHLEDGFISTIFLIPQRDRGTEVSNQLQKLKRIHTELPFQDGRDTNAKDKPPPPHNVHIGIDPDVAISIYD